MKTTNMPSYIFGFKKLYLQKKTFIPLNTLLYKMKSPIFPLPVEVVHPLSTIFLHILFAHRDFQNELREGRRCLVLLSEAKEP